MGDGLVRVADIHEQPWPERARATRRTTPSPAGRWRATCSRRRSCPRTSWRTTCAWPNSRRRACRRRTGRSSGCGTRSGCGRGTPARAAAAPSSPLQAEDLRARLGVGDGQVEHRGVVHVKPRRVAWRNLELDQPNRPVLEQLSMMRFLIDGRNRVLSFTGRIRRLRTGLSMKHCRRGERATGKAGDRREKS